MGMSPQQLSDKGNYDWICIENLHEMSGRSRHVLESGMYCTGHAVTYDVGRYRKIG